MLDKDFQVAVVAGAVGGLVVAIFGAVLRAVASWWFRRKFLKGCSRSPGSRDDDPVGPDYTKAA